MNSEAHSMDPRSQKVHQIRPDLQLSTDVSQTFEFFQNEVIRPILKFQNDLFLISFRESKQFQQQMARVDSTNKLHLEKGLADFLNSNNAFKNRMYGYVLGLMTCAEFQEYLKDESEYNRRIRAMLVKRVFGQLYGI